MPTDLPNTVDFPGTPAQVRPLQTAVQIPTSILSQEGAFLELGYAGDSLSPGTLVEVETNDKLYLGEVEFCDEGVVRIRCDHFLDLTLLKEIRSRWNLSPEPPTPALSN